MWQSVIRSVLWRCHAWMVPLFRLGCEGNYCYALVKANEAGATGLTGERLW